jgi:hypothetical protein
MNLKPLGCVFLSGAIATLLTGLFNPSAARLLHPLGETPAPSQTLQIAQACQGNQRYVADIMGVDVYTNNFDASPNGQRIAQGIAVTVAGVTFGSGATTRVLISSPVQGWVLDSGLTCAQVAPSPTPQPSLSPTPQISPSPSPPARPIVTRCVRRIPQVGEGLALNSDPGSLLNIRNLGYAPGESFQTDRTIRPALGRNYLFVTGPRSGWIALNGQPPESNVSYIGQCPQ